MQHMFKTASKESRDKLLTPTMHDLDLKVDMSWKKNKAHLVNKIVGNINDYEARENLLSARNKVSQSLILKNNENHHTVSSESLDNNFKIEINQDSRLSVTD